MVVHYRHTAIAALLLSSVALPLQAQIRAPWGPRPAEDEVAPRRHSIVTVWAEALESLSHPNPLLRWHAARLAAQHSLAFDDDKLTRAWMRERDLRVRVALKRSLIQRGKGEDLIGSSTTNLSSCAEPTAKIHADETRPIAELLALLESRADDERAKLTFELALALRKRKNANSRTVGLHALRAHALDEHLLLLRGVARDDAVTSDLLSNLRSETAAVRREAVDALGALGASRHRAALLSALRTERNPDVARALLKTLRRQGTLPSPSVLASMEQRVQQYATTEKQNGLDQDLSRYQVEYTRAALATAEPHELLHRQAQRTVRTWLSPSNPLAGLALHVMSGQRSVPVFSVAPYVDDPRSQVRATAVRVLTPALTSDHALHTWLALEALDSKTREALQPDYDPPPNEPAVPTLLQSAQPVFIAWNAGHELAVPTPTRPLFIADAPSNAAFCRSEQTWVAIE